MGQAAKACDNYTPANARHDGSLCGQVAKEKDFLAIEKILDLDARGLYDIVKTENISMCGFQPTTAAIIASNELKAKKAELIKYQTSGDVSGDFFKVVGYAGIRII